MDCRAVNQDGTASASNFVDVVLHSANLEDTAGGAEVVMKGVNVVMDAGRCRNKIWAEGRPCRTFEAVTGEAVDEKLNFGKGDEMDANLEARLS